MGAALLQKLSSSSFELIVTFFHYFHYALFMAIPLHSLSGMERVFLLQLWVIHGR
jgi:hypothetical protein